MRILHGTGLPNIEFRHLWTFLTLARLGNFSQTGRQVGLSQSAVSRHIHALEDALGLRLFQRLVAEIPDQIVFIAPPAHPLAGRRLRSRDLASCDFIHRDAPSDTRALTDRWFQAERARPRTVMEVG